MKNKKSPSKFHLGTYFTHVEKMYKKSWIFEALTD